MSDYLERISALSPEKLALLAADNPLSYGQQRLWLLNLLDPDSPVYNIPAALRLTGGLDVAALRRALDEVVSRHEILRTTFPTIEGKAIQIVHPERLSDLSVADLSSLPAGEGARQAREMVFQEARRPFDLSLGPLVRAGLINLAERDHVLTVTMHHIVSDGWSSGVLINELSALYNAFSAGLPSPLPELAIQYGDYARWERDWLQGEVVERQIDYWKRQLKGADEALDLPADRPRPAALTHRGARRRLQIPREVSKGLKTLCRREGATLYMGLLAGFKTLLSRYSRQEEISVGTPVANRRLVETEGLIGFFVNTVVMRTDLGGAKSYVEVLRRVKESALGAYSHQEAPFEKLVEELKPERSLSRSPLFQAAFDLQTLSAINPPSLNGLTVHAFEFDNQVAKFDLSLSMLDTADELSGSIQYNTDLFDDSTIDRMAGHFVTLLGSIVRDPDGPIAALRMMSEAERRRALHEWNNTGKRYETGRLIHHLVSEHAGLRPEAAAVVAGGQMITYGELERRGNQLARYLNGRGIGVEKTVGVCVERGIDMIVGLLGILKAGAAYVPLDPSYPPERIAYMAEDAGMELVLTQRNLAEILPDRLRRDGVKLVCLDTNRAEIDLESGERIDGGAAGANLAYVIYTSGSTGRPKGVLIQHDCLMNLVRWHNETYQVSALDRATQVASPGFDASVLEIWPCLAGGASLYIPDDLTRASAGSIKDYLSEHSITVCFLPTPLAELALKEEWPAQSSLKTLHTGGDKLTTRPRPGLPFEVFNLYGPTENTIVTTSFAVAPANGGSAPPPIGRPLANTRTYILDDNMEPAPIGVGGELQISGAGLARGYLNRPELTAERFIPDPFSAAPGARLYRTGDLARYLADGNIEFLGRIDGQVKIRGFRIEPGEIEAALAGHETVREVVVVAREDQHGEKRLIAYVGTGGREAVSAGDLRAFLRERLPDYMTPSAFVLTPELPRTPNGKIDRKSLPAPDSARQEASTPFLAPGTPLEQSVAVIWREVLNLDRVGVNDNFFDLGGHSLLAVRIHERLRKEVNPDLPLLKLFQYPTVRTLAEFLSEGRESQSPTIEQLVGQPGEQPGEWADRRKQALARQRQMRNRNEQSGNNGYARQL